MTAAKTIVANTMNPEVGLEFSDIALGYKSVIVQASSQALAEPGAPGLG